MVATRLRDIAWSVMDEIGLARPSSFAGASDPNARRMTALITATGQALYRAHDWSVLHREYTFTTVDGVDNYAVPEDWGRAVSSTAWDRDTFWRGRGALTPQEWQLRRSGLVSAGANRYAFRALIGPRQASLLIDPVPTGASDLVIEYISKWWIEASDGTGREEFTTDTHHTRIDEELFRLGLLWRAKREYGFQYADDRDDYEVELKAARVGDLALPPVNMAGPADMPFWPNVPDGSFTAPE